MEVRETIQNYGQRNFNKRCATKKTKELVVRGLGNRRTCRSSHFTEGVSFDGFKTLGHSRGGRRSGFD